MPPSHFPVFILDINFWKQMFTCIGKLSYQQRIRLTGMMILRKSSILCNQQATFLSHLLTDAKPDFIITFANLFLKLCFLWKETQNLVITARQQWEPCPSYTFHEVNASWEHRQESLLFPLTHSTKTWASSF